MKKLIIKLKTINKIDLFYYVLHIILSVTIPYYIIVLIIITLLFKLFIYFTNSKYKKLYFENNVFVYGNKGKGKDLLLQHYVNLDNKKQFLSNIDYGSNCDSSFSLRDVFNLNSLSYLDLIDNNFVKRLKKEHFENKTMIISDSSIYFPAHSDSEVKKYFPDLTIFFAISRHLYNMNIIVNTQNVDRLFKGIREQSNDGYIRALRTDFKLKIFRYMPFVRNYLMVSYRFYENKNSMEMGLMPFGSIATANNFLGKTIYTTPAGATKQQYESEKGLIFNSKVLIPIKSIRYDTRAFHQIVFGNKFIPYTIKKIKESKNVNIFKRFFK